MYLSFGFYKYEILEISNHNIIILFYLLELSIILVIIIKYILLLHFKNSQFIVKKKIALK